MKSKKGFTLVELLAVIVILALIMGIAVVSIGGILQSTRQSTFKETAAGIIDGVQKQLMIGNELKEGYYTFTADIVEKGGTESPLGGNILYKGTSGATAQGLGTYKQIGTSPVYRINTDATHGVSCGPARESYVRVQYNASNFKYTYSICLTAGTGNYYINNAEYTTLLGSDTSMIVKPS